MKVSKSEDWGKPGSIILFESKTLPIDLLA